MLMPLVYAYLSRLGLNSSPLWVDILRSGVANQLGSVSNLGTPPITNAREMFHN